MTQTELSKAKVQYIIENFPQYLSSRVNPFTQPKVVVEVKEALYKCGLYSSRYDSSSANVDNAVINLILKAQGKERIKRPYVGRSRIGGSK